MAFNRTGVNGANGSAAGTDGADSGSGSTAGGIGGAGMAGGAGQGFTLTYGTSNPEDWVTVAGSEGGAGTAGGNGGDGGQTQTDTHDPATNAVTRTDIVSSAGGAGGRGGNGGASGRVTLTESAITVIGTIKVSIRMNAGGDAGNGGAGGAASEGLNITNSAMNFVQHSPGARGGNGGAGGSGGADGAIMVDLNGIADPYGNVSLLGTTSEAGKGGDGGDAANGRTGGTGGAGGAGGAGGDVSLRLNGSQFTFNTTHYFGAGANAGGDGGAGGSGGTGVLKSVVYFGANSLTTPSYNHGTGGAGGRGGNGGNAHITITDTAFKGTSGNEQLTLDFELESGRAGAGGQGGLGGDGVTRAADGAKGAVGVTSLTLTGNLIDGGAGTDQFNLLLYNYAGEKSGFRSVGQIVIDLAAGIWSVGNGGSNTVRNVENVTIQLNEGYYGDDHTTKVAVTSAKAILTGDGHDNVLNATAGQDTLNGGGGNDLLDGKAGRDTMSGGTGDDTFIVDLSSDLATENADEGYDTVRSTVSYILSANIEELVLLGTAAINGTGNDSDNVITGNSNTNILNGNGGNDILSGGGGSQDKLFGGDGDDVLSGANQYGGNGNDTLLYGNYMQGGTGDDTYYLSSYEVVVEALNQGHDTVIAGYNYVLPANVEDLYLKDGPNFSGYNGTGNSLNNLIVAGAGPNRLDGKGGADTMVAGDGNDTYVVDNTGDIVMEVAGQGSDVVESSVTYTLPGNVETLILTGTANISGIGSFGDDAITGNAGNNHINGRTGNDSMYGGPGADTFVFGPGSGLDTIMDFLSSDDYVDISAYTHGVAHGGGVTITFDSGTLTIHLSPGNQIMLPGVGAGDPNFASHIIW